MCCAGAGTCSFVAQASCTGLWNLGGTCTPNPCTPFLATILVTRSGSGSGVVRSVPAGIDCAATCAFAFPIGGALTLVPTPNPGSVVDGWEGGSDGTCAGTGNCAFIVAGPISVNAVFRCRADFNGAGGTNVQDIFDFLAAWFVGDPRADFNGVGGNTVQDIFDFLSAWFAGCP